MCIVLTFCYQVLLSRIKGKYLYSIYNNIYKYVRKPSFFVNLKWNRSHRLRKWVNKYRTLELSEDKCVSWHSFVISSSKNKTKLLEMIVNKIFAWTWTELRQVCTKFISMRFKDSVGCYQPGDKFFRSIINEFGLKYVLCNLCLYGCYINTHSYLHYIKRGCCYKVPQ